MNEPQREQTRRDALEKIRIVERGNRMQRIVLTNAEADALLAELEQAEQRAEDADRRASRSQAFAEQAERERDEAKWGRDWQYDKAIGWRNRCVKAEVRLAKVPALVEALSYYTHEWDGGSRALIALADSEQE